MIQRAEMESWSKIAWPNLIGDSGIPYLPNHKQKPATDAFMDGCRFMIIYGGERSGKSQTASAAAILDMKPLPDKKERRYWIVGPDYRESRPEFSYLYNSLNDLKLIKSASMPHDERTSWSFTTNYGVKVETRTSYDFSKLASFSIHGAIMCEAAKQDFNVWLKLRGRVSETRGWVIMVGTPEDALPWYGEMFERWKANNPDGGRSFSLPTHSNIAVYPGGKDDPEIVSLQNAFGMTDTHYNERYGGITTKSARAVIPEFDMENHVVDLEVLDNSPIELCIDPGQRAYAVGFVQPVGLSTLYVHDCVYTRDMIGKDVISLCMEHPLWPRVNFSNKFQGCIDFAGKHKNATESQIELWEEIAGVSLEHSYRFVGVTLGVVRYRLKNNFIYFSSSMRTGSTPGGKATEGLSEFSLWKWPKVASEQRENDLPPDTNNHFIKALGYYCDWKYGHKDVNAANKKKTKRPKIRTLAEYEGVLRARS